MTGAIRYTCRTPNCSGECSFDSETFIPDEWLCPKCAAEYAYQLELAEKLVRLAVEKERTNA